MWSISVPRLYAYDWMATQDPKEDGRESYTLPGTISEKTRLLLSSKKEPEPSDGAIIRTYWWRWVVLAVFVLNLGSNNFMWITFGPIEDVIRCYYNVSNFWVNSLSMTYMVTYIMLVVPSSWLLVKLGLRATTILGSFTTVLGACLRLAGLGEWQFVWESGLWGPNWAAPPLELCPTHIHWVFSYWWPRGGHSEYAPSYMCEGFECTVIPYTNIWRITERAKSYNPLLMASRSQGHAYILRSKWLIWWLRDQHELRMTRSTDQIPPCDSGRWAWSITFDPQPIKISIQQCWMTKDNSADQCSWFQ